MTREEMIRKINDLLELLPDILVEEYLWDLEGATE